MKLRQISQGDDVTTLGLNGMERGAAILIDVECRANPGDLERKETKQGAAGGSTITRLINTDNTAIQYTPAYRNVTKMIVSRDIKVDKVVEGRSENPVSVLADRTEEEMFYVGQLFQAMCFIGDSGSVATDFDGLENLISYGRSLDADIVLPVGGDDVRDLQQLAIEKLLEHAENVITFQPDGLVHAYVNGQLKVRILTLAKTLGYLREVQKPDVSYVDQIIGEKIIIRSAGLDSGGSYLLPFSESYNGGNSSSFWFVAWDENGTGVHLLTSQGLVGEYAGLVGNFWQNNFNMDAVLGVRNSNALVRSRGWKLS